MSLMIAEFLLTYIWIMALFVVHEFIVSKDGMLRKIMIAYFLIEAILYAGGGGLMYKYWDIIPADVRVAIYVAIVLKAGIKVWLLKYLRGIHKKK